MANGINGELRLFLVSVLAGMILFGVYDIGKAFRKAVRHKNGWVAVEDVLYWIFAALFLFYIFFAFNEGVLRNYVILGSLVGIVFYSFFFRSLFFQPVLKLFQLAGGIWGLVHRLFYCCRKFF